MSEYDGRGLATRMVDALGNVTVTEYDGNGNVKKVTDADGYVTEYTYNGLDMVTQINYNGGKQAHYQYNAVGDLVEMTDWTGTNTFEVDLLSRVTRATDHKGRVTEYAYDSTGNQTSVKYPDGTTAVKEYDLVGNLTKVTEADGRATTYAYDGMRRVTHMSYPDGWQEDYTYDAIGQVLSIYDTDPSGKDMKQQKNKFEYDACGSMTYEYMRGNGTGEATTEVFYTYDELHQVVSAKENYGNKTRSYQYDSLGSLTWETNSNNVTVDYKLNNLNQITVKSDDGWKTSTAYTYDRRGNLTQETYTKGKKTSVSGAYTYDETNKMVLGVNDIGESSAYLYNGLGALVQNTWIIKKNAYGYHDVSALTATAMVEGELVVDKATGKKDKKDKKDPEVVAASPSMNKTSTVVKHFVVDYTRETRDPLMEYEENGLTYRYVYGNERLSVNVTGIETGSGHIVENGNQIRLYYHTDLRGTFDYLTSPVSKKVESWTHYNEWGEITHNAVLKCGQRELDLVKNYTGHDYDAVLGQYYAKARFYDPGDRRFTAMDPVKGNVMDPLSLVQYIYVHNRPLIWVDMLGKYYIVMTAKPNGTEYPDIGFKIAPEDGLPSQLKAFAAKIPFVSDIIKFMDQNSNLIYGGTGAIQRTTMDYITDFGDFLDNFWNGLIHLDDIIIDVIDSDTLRSMADFKNNTDLVFFAADVLGTVHEVHERFELDKLMFEVMKEIGYDNYIANTVEEAEFLVNTIVANMNSMQPFDNNDFTLYDYFFGYSYKFTCAEPRTHGMPLVGENLYEMDKYAAGHTKEEYLKRYLLNYEQIDSNRFSSYLRQSTDYKTANGVRIMSDYEYRQKVLAYLDMVSYESALERREKIFRTIGINVLNTMSDYVFYNG